MKDIAAGMNSSAKTNFPDKKTPVVAKTTGIFVLPLRRGKLMIESLRVLWYDALEEIFKKGARKYALALSPVRQCAQ